MNMLQKYRTTEVNNIGVIKSYQKREALIKETKIDISPYVQQ